MADRERGTAGKKEAYRIVDMPIIASPCRTCRKCIFHKLSCSDLRRFRKMLEIEFSGYGVAENNY